MILVHGFTENAYASWAGLAPILAAQGYCVFAPTLGTTTGIPWLGATGNGFSDAAELDAVVRRVLDATGADRVDLIGHSKGAAIARYVANTVAPESVRSVVGIAAANTEGEIPGYEQTGAALTAVRDALAAVGITTPPLPERDPAFFDALTEGGETRPGIRYTMIATPYDTIVTPWDTGFVSAVPGSEVRNVALPGVCPEDLSDHVSIQYSKNVAQLVLDVLDPHDVRPIRCSPQAPVVGSTR
ncbi:esterase/lipase family protein [Rhodococcus rhodnii]|uniref:Triacylglycerol lipase n=1 Tax=Rhodococcus rhodnii LMG 5362 TaxID=1273125 RepID=R7WRE1_9NOCA|nr:alpha/beta fold hydrolase [Rhodococcus rhodnii]EOM77888.1 triacylglycerol lipase [Rhodococcus rhodnii LMG 5362]